LMAGAAPAFFAPLAFAVPFFFSAIALVSRFRSSPNLDASVPSELRNHKGH
jgi:hypothetical protein